MTQVRKQGRFGGALMRRGLAVLAIAASVVGVGVPVQASQTGAGSWSATLTLSEYPCTGGCSGSLTGNVQGGISGLDVNGAPYTVTFPDPAGAPLTGNLSSTFLYSEGCELLDPLPVIGGDAGAQFTVVNGVVDDNGQIIHGATLTGTFAWSRTGVVVALISTSGGQLSAGGRVIATETEPLGQGAGLFVPLGDPGLCTHTAPLTVLLAGGWGSPA